MVSGKIKPPSHAFAMFLNAFVYPSDNRAGRVTRPLNGGQGPLKGDAGLRQEVRSGLLAAKPGNIGLKMKSGWTGMSNRFLFKERDRRKNAVLNHVSVVSVHKWSILVSGKARARFPAWRDFPSDLFQTVGVNRRNSTLFRGLKTSANAARGRKMPFMDGHYLRISDRPSKRAPS